MHEILQVQGKDAVVKLNDYPAINAIQNFDWEPRFNEEYMMELGNANHAAQTIMPEVSGSFELMATGASVAMLRRMITTKTGTEYNGYLAGLPSDANPNTGTIRSIDLENAVFDVIENKKPGQVFSRSTLLPRMHLSSISMKADANGNAHETYNFEGDIVRILPSPKHDVVTVPAVRTGATEDDKQITLQLMGTAYDDVSLDGTADYDIVFVMIDDVIVPTTALNVTLNPGEITLDAPYKAYAGQRVSVVLFKNTPGTFPSIAYPTAARFMKANQIDIFLVAKSTIDISAMADGDLTLYDFSQDDIFLRAQSMDLNIDLRREALKQIRKSSNSSAVFYRAATYPLNVTSSVNVLETTMEDHAKLTGKTSTDILDLDSFQGEEWQLVRRDYLNGTTLQTTVLLDAKVSGSGRRVSAGGRAEISWSFTGSNVVWEGV